MAVEIRINGFNGEICRVFASPDWLGSQLKTAVQAASGISASQMRFLAGCMELDDTKTLAAQLSRAVSGGVDLTLLRRPAEQADWMDRVKADGLVLRDAPWNVRHDREIVLAAVKQNGETLSFLTPKQQEDREIVFGAVTQNGTAVRYASLELQADYALALAAVHQDGAAMRHIVPELRMNWDFLLAAIQDNPSALLFASPEVRDDKRFILKAVARDPRGEVLQFATPRIRSDRDVVLAAVRHNWQALHSVPREYLEDREVVNSCALQNLESLKYVSATSAIQAGVPSDMLELCTGRGSEFGARVLLPGDVDIRCAVPSFTPKLSARLDPSRTCRDPVSPHRPMYGLGALGARVLPRTGGFLRPSLGATWGKTGSNEMLSTADLPRTPRRKSGVRGGRALSAKAARSPPRHTQRVPSTGLRVVSLAASMSREYGSRQSPPKAFADSLASLRF